MNRHRIVAMTGQEPDRRLHRPSIIGQLDQIAIGQPQRGGSGRAEQGGVFPGQFGERFGQFL